MHVNTWPAWDSLPAVRHEAGTGGPWGGGGRAPRTQPQHHCLVGRGTGATHGRPHRTTATTNEPPTRRAPKAAIKVLAPRHERHRGGRVRRAPPAQDGQAQQRTVREARVYLAPLVARE